jgi:hypothetical protein
VTLEPPTDPHTPSPPQAHENAANKEGNPQGTELPTVRPEMQSPPAHPYCKITCEKTRDGWDRAKMAAEFVGIIFLIIYTLYTAGIYCANREAAEATQKTFGEIQQQTKMIRQQLVGTQAAVMDYLTPAWRGPSEADRGEIIQTIVNHGLVSAKNVQLEITETRQRLSDFQALETPVKFHKGPEDVRTGDKFILEWHTPWEMKILSNPEGPSFPLKTWPKDWPGTDTVEIRGAYSYDNGFGDKISRDFCLRWIPMFSYQPATSSYGYGFGGSPTCEDTLTIIQWSLAKRKEMDTQR